MEAKPSEPDPEFLRQAVRQFQDFQRMLQSGCATLPFALDPIVVDTTPAAVALAKGELAVWNERVLKPAVAKFELEMPGYLEANHTHVDGLSLRVKEALAKAPPGAATVDVLNTCCTVARCPISRFIQLVASLATTAQAA